MDDLIAKLEAAESGSRELDDALFVRFFDRADAMARPVVGGGVIVYGPGFDAKSVPVPPVTTSLDAALALAERVLPGWCVNIDTDGNASVWDTKHLDTTCADFSMGQPALALCKAILRATGTKDPASEGGRDE